MDCVSLGGVVEVKGSRLFTFGCSFTNYRWPTWADLLGTQFAHYQNWAQSGAGNHFIFNSLIEANQRHSLGESDTVLVCWTNVMREDRYTDRWQTLGNITSCPIYNKDYVRAAVTERGSLIRDLAMIQAAKTVLEQTGATWRFLSVCDLGNVHQFDDTETPDQDVLNVYRDALDIMLPSFRSTVFAQGWRNQGDPHPTPLEHLQYLDAVLPGWMTNCKLRVKIANEAKNLTMTQSGLSTVTRL